MFSFEKLDVYRIAEELRKIVVKRVLGKCRAEMRDQLDRASTSILLNIAEGAGRTQPKEKRRFYEYARGSAAESASVLRVLRIDGLVDEEDFVDARAKAESISRMLMRLIQQNG